MRIGRTTAPAASRDFTARSNASAYPSGIATSDAGTATTGRGGAARGASGGRTGSLMIAIACRPSSSVRAKIVTQSKLRQAGTTPVVGTSPYVGFTPTICWNAAGTRPDPAVSVPTPRSAMPSATTTADPELDPPDTRSGSRTSRTAPYGLRVPTSPVAN